MAAGPGINGNRASSPGVTSRTSRNLNFDMLGSPNFVRFVYDGNGSDAPVNGSTGSADAEDVFLDYFASRMRAFR
jgi:Zn-dependent M28 family amino/carboxypeptidase